MLANIGLLGLLLSFGIPLLFIYLAVLLIRRAWYGPRRKADKDPDRTHKPSG